MCTAGRCRSPIAAALLAKRLEPLHADVSVGSVGLRFTGEPTPEVGVSLMAQRGIDLTAHRSSRITANEVHDADLVLGMTREHVREIVGMSPDAWAKTYTLRDFVRRAREVGPRRRRQRFDGWLDVVGAERTPKDVLGSNADDEVHDPFGQRPKVWQQVIDDIDDLVSAIPTLIGLRGERQSPNRAWSV